MYRLANRHCKKLAASFCLAVRSSWKMFKRRRADTLIPKSLNRIQNPRGRPIQLSHLFHYYSPSFLFLPSTLFHLFLLSCILLAFVIFSYQRSCYPKVTGAPANTHTGWAKKVNPEYSTHNFVKYWPTFKILSLSRKFAIKRSPQSCRYTTL